MNGLLGTAVIVGSILLVYALYDRFVMAPRVRREEGEHRPPRRLPPA